MPQGVRADDGSARHHPDYATSRECPTPPEEPDIGAFELQALVARVQSPFKTFVIATTPITIQT